MRNFVKVLLLVCAVCATGCDSSISDAINYAVNEPDPQPIDTTKIGVNAFVNDSRFGTISAQFGEVRDTLHISHVRVLFNWNDGVQASPSSSLNFSFYDSIINDVPSGVDVDVVLTGIPSWMNTSSNWVNGNPRTTFAEKWVQPVINRYGRNGKIIAFEVWNEPNATNADDTTMGFVGNAANYVELLMTAHDIIKAGSSAMVWNAATTSPNEDYPDALNYNRDMRDAGATAVVDRWNIHYYGKEYENTAQSGGVADFLNGLSVPTVVSESGEQGVNQQLDYGKRVWPFLISQIPSIERIYIYQFTEATDPSVTYGLKNLSTATPISDLYIYLRDGGG